MILAPQVFSPFIQHMLRTARGIERGLLVVAGLAKFLPGLIDIFARRTHRILHGLHCCFLARQRVLGYLSSFASGLDVLQAALDGGHALMSGILRLFRSVYRLIRELDRRCAGRDARPSLRHFLLRRKHFSLRGLNFLARRRYLRAGGIDPAFFAATVGAVAILARR